MRETHISPAADGRRAVMPTMERVAHSRLFWVVIAVLIAVIVAVVLIAALTGSGGGGGGGGY
jgi:hypothetical protein